MQRFAPIRKFVLSIRFDSIRECSVNWPFRFDSCIKHPPQWRTQTIKARRTEVTTITIHYSYVLLSLLLVTITSVGASAWKPAFSAAPVSAAPRLLPGPYTYACTYIRRMT